MLKISESKILYWLSLCQSAPRKQKFLIKQFGSLERLWDEFSAQKSAISAIIGNSPCQKLERFHNAEFIENSLLKLRDFGVSVITMKNPLYPKSLVQAEVDGPLVLYYKGDIELLNYNAIAVVGTRSCTNYGKQVTREIASTLVNNGIVVISGIATGIDTYALESTLDNSGKAIAVLPCGHNQISPVASIKVIERIINNSGLVISEYPPEFAPTKYSYGERNRLISGLSKGVVVTEADERSGALNTANCALEQGREVFAVPGPVNSIRSRGCNNLLYQGANFTRNGDDILSFFGIKSQNEQTKGENRPKIFVDKDKEKVYIQLMEGVKTLDELVIGTQLCTSRLSEVLLEMELDGYIERTSANAFELKRN